MANFFDDSFFNNNMDDIFNQIMRQSNGNSSARYMVNGHELTPDEFAQYRMTGKLPDKNQEIKLEKNGEHAIKRGGILDKLGRNLTKEAQDNLLDPVIGRDKEIEETAEILSRRIKNNPILVGDAGVGKTAIVEGLAQAIVAEKVPESIKNKQIYSIDLSSLEAGTQYRGSFEENIKNLIKEVKAAGNIILFFDEIHQILGLGSGDDKGGKGFSDIIKPALSRGEITVIGATTQDEYRNTILKDTALARRFNDVVVNEPTAEDTFKILKGIKELYEKHHDVVIPDEVLRDAVNYSIQYIPQRTLPDKAIDLIDMTAAHLAAKRSENNPKDLKSQLSAAKSAKETAVKNEEFEKAAKAKHEIDRLEKLIKNNHSDDSNDDSEKVTVKANDIAKSVERLTGIPVSKMGTNDIERLKGISSRLKGKVIGQDEAVEMVARAIRRNRAGFDDGNRPIGSFLFVGPTGVGKTELAKQLALDMFGNKNAIIRLDMSEYSDRTAVSKLIGASAGYVGYDDNSNTLTERVRRNPYSIVLLDEIEKADPQVLTLLLQVMDDGRLTDAQGNVINFKNTIIIATSNAGFGHEKLSGDDKKQSIMDRLAPYFRPEFLNRFNGIVQFSHLTKEDLSQIVDLMLEDVNKTLATKQIHLTVSDDAKAWLMEQGYDEAMGARPLRRVIEQEIRDKVTDYYLDHLDDKELEANLVEDKIVISHKD
ncbi:AAA family ATPase [Apilactobacillus xinyiensis]|uniref:ATP-dependent Clp protease ATP-binding subunit n=1 Tax=Apilactobacillus xinyiensis TaxID=2841032 RepID=A0ABT0I1V4_9LACO|nr:ATP-dependent Clp protease ATP-binding subunit [Apilactobacillus xinyiensis]MCK8624699.1 ATP-dependent Clp protease ATP-binding subunit [Apilactobacillus xinyiensis]MCL0318814.1 ATP-dependent Clp protease ATP-binding subunit [Apilactobacillus xinyiensis]